METVRMGIIGIGNMGHCHAEQIAAGHIEGMVLTAVADIKPERLDWAKEKLGDTVARFATAEELMDSGLVDAVLIATPWYEKENAVGGHLEGIGFNEMIIAVGEN